jgi:hypothetical protein
LKGGQPWHPLEFDYVVLAVAASAGVACASAVGTSIAADLIASVKAAASGQALGGIGDSANLQALPGAAIFAIFASYSLPTGLEKCPEIGNSADRDPAHTLRDTGIISKRAVSVSMHIKHQ